MPQTYESAAQFEHLFTELFARIEAADSGGFDDLVSRRMAVRFRVTEPDVEMLVDGSSAPVVTSFGPSDVKATLTVDLTGDSLHELLLGTLPLGKALSSKRLRVKGSKLKAMRLQNLFHTFQSVYPDLAAEQLGDS
jgi:putative sterol carrier protein